MQHRQALNSSQRPTRRRDRERSEEGEKAEKRANYCEHCTAYIRRAGWTGWRERGYERASAERDAACGKRALAAEGGRGRAGTTTSTLKKAKEERNPASSTLLLLQSESGGEQGELPPNLLGSVNNRSKTPISANLPNLVKIRCEIVK